MLLAELTPAQFAGWQAYYALEPWGEDRADLRMARQVWAIFQSGSRAKINESDFIFDFDPQASRAATPEEYKRRAMAAWTGAGGGLITDG